MKFQPMLATDADLSTVRFPLLASAKLDGIRAVVRNGVVLSRSLKNIPNEYVQHKFSGLENFDGELIVGDPRSKTCYRDTVSHVMSHDKRDFHVTFYAFDLLDQPEQPYHARADRLRSTVAAMRSSASGVVILDQHYIDTLSRLLVVEDLLLTEGYEGLILRDADAPYKFGRSTAKQGYLLKLKRFVDAEAVVIGFEERMHNANPATIDERGYTHRSSHQENKIGLGDLGALVCDFRGVTVKIGTGFDAEERRQIWGNQSRYSGRLVKFKYFDYGSKDAPRHPVFLGWRDSLDI